MSTTPDRSWFWDGVPLVGQAMFWLTLAVVTVLTYRHARQTVLAPLKTEVFKLQVELMRGVLQDFIGKSELQLNSFFGLDEAFEANAEKLYDDYAFSAFGALPAPLASRSYDFDTCPSAWISADDLTLADDYVLPAGRPDREPRLPPKRVTLWSDYEYTILVVPRTTSDRLARLDGLVSDPLLPTGCATLLAEVKVTVEEALHGIRKVLNEASPNMSIQYPTLDDLRNSSVNWLHHRWIDDRVGLEPAVKALVNFTREYFASDELRLSDSGRRRRGRR